MKKKHFSIANRGRGRGGGRGGGRGRCLAIYGLAIYDSSIYGLAIHGMAYGLAISSMTIWGMPIYGIAIWQEHMAMTNTWQKREIIPKGTSERTFFAFEDMSRVSFEF